ncbi:hypothetical protein DFJ58DRAFT_748489 [Suillus subalutaceus]|uniref:uncharacterized protein n=1 Tax=Suillus subalutaceus TaxID=48586 RepID=UPI001B87AC5C|nr:uncharacterized protein DFJ58DRAFT_748489 [Suillus subalutaceus]KAG1841212.1 hypothetical protein DFJ58DRAFT_748489 [Suillus subalutaceus]
MVQQKAKVICTRLLERHIAAERAGDERGVQLGSRDHARDDMGYWQQDLQRIWLVARPRTLMTHIRDCDLHAKSVRSRAQGELMNGSPNKSARFNQLMQPAAELSVPQLYSDSPQITALIPPHVPSSASASPMLGLHIPGSSASASGSLQLLSLPSPLAFDSRAPSPAMSDISLLPVHVPSKRQHMSHAGAYRSVSQPVALSLLPHIGACVTNSKYEPLFFLKHS